MLKKLIYIIQFRTDASEEHEKKCFNEQLSDYQDNLVFINAVNQELSLEKMPNVAAIILGGSGQFYASKDDQRAPHKKTLDFIDRVLEAEIPLLGICYGMQMLCVKYGSKMVDDKKYHENGSFLVEKLAAADSDPLLGKMPQEFFGQFGHKEAAINIPDDLICLARSERVDCQAVRVKGKDAWGVLFHAELNYQHLRERTMIFPDYASDPQNLEESMKNFQEAPESNDFLRFFVKLALDKNH